MKFFKPSAAVLLCLVLMPLPLHALKSDRKEPLEVKADATSGTLGDGLATLRGQVEINQGSLEIRADVANVSKTEGRVTHIELTGSPVRLQQEIEQEGLVVAQADKVDYEVATGIVTLTGAADVLHPQYRISGDTLVYDMNVQHFQGSSGDQNGRIQIRLDPELLPGNAPAAGPEPPEDAPQAEAEVDPGAGAEDPADETGGEG